MDLDQIWVVTRRRELFGADALHALEAELGGKLPASHHALLARFGAGSFVDILRILSPDEILAERALVIQHESFAPRHTIGWKNFADYVSPDARSRLAPLAISLDGDMVIANLDDPSMLFIVPRNRSAIDLAETFPEALAYFSPKRPWFESHVGRVEHELTITGASDDPYEAVGHLLEDLPPDHDGVELNPSDELFYRDADAVVQWLGNARLRLRADESTHAAFLARVVASLARGGWTTK